MAFSHSGGVVTQSNGPNQAFTGTSAITGGVRFNDTGHPFSVGDFVEITGTTDYNGAWTITATTANTYDIVHPDISFTTSQSGNAALGDKDLSGLVGITGVSTNTEGDITYYEFNSSTEFVINGALKQDPRSECIVMTRNLSALPNDGGLIDVNNGIWDIGGSDIVEGFELFWRGDAVIYTGNPTGSNIEFLITVDNDGTMIWRSGRIIGNTPNIDVDGAMRIFSDFAVWEATTTTVYNSHPQIRMEGSDYLITGLTAVGREGANTQINFRASDVFPFSGYKPTHMGIGITPSGQTTDDLFTIEGFVAQGNDRDAATRSGKQLRYRNNEQGTTFKVGPRNTGNQNHGLVEVTQEIDYTALDPDGTALEGATIYCIDTDNGNRENFTRQTPNTNFVNDRVYNETSNASGVFPTIEVLLGAWVNNSTSSAGSTTPNVGNWAPDYRGNNNDDSDLFNFYLFQYDSLPLSDIDVQLKGVNPIPRTVRMLPDLGITATKATADAYTTLANGEQLYDRQKSWKIANVTDEYPSISEHLITAAGNTLTLHGPSGLSLTIDGGMASPPLAVDQVTDTLTIDAGTTFAPTGKYDRIVGNVTVEDATVIDGWTIDGDLTLNNANDLTDVTVTGDLRIATGADSTLNFSNVSVSGSVFNDSASNTLTINASDSLLSAGDPGTGNGQTNIVSSVPVTITVVDATGSPIENARVYLETSPGGVEVFDGSDGTSLTNASGQVTTSFGGTTPVTISGRARKSSSAPFYKTGLITGQISTSGLDTTVVLVLDQ